MITVKYKVQVFIATTVVLLFGTVCLCASTDDVIVEGFKKSYVFKTYLKGDPITIISKSGVVTLKGTVAKEFHRSLANETAANLPGVKRVDNKLEIKKVDFVNNADTLLSRKIKAMLLFHNNVSAAKTKISVKNGNVTLQGEADSQAQKELTEEYVDDIKGVKDVKNEMNVKAATEKPGKTIYNIIDDASITSQVRTELFLHKSTSVFRTGVETKDGIVTLSGKVKNAAEKDLVTKFAKDIEGVKKVINNMTLE